MLSGYHLPPSSDEKLTLIGGRGLTLSENLNGEGGRENFVGEAKTENLEPEGNTLSARL